jgi:phage terminase large subunit-like protein
MPELRGHQATEEVKQEWAQAYKLYLKAPGDPRNQKNDRAERIEYVAKEMNLTHKQAKRRVRNYESWQRNIKKHLVEP